MKRKKKAFLTVLCAFLLIAASAAGTMAYLTSNDTAVNTFTVGNVAIKLDEAKVNEDGSLVKDADRVKENTYKLIPGHTYHKDPMVTVLKGSEKSYIKLVVMVNKSKELDAIGVDLTKTFVGYDSTNWIYQGNKKDTTYENMRTYEFWYKEPVGAPDIDVKLDPLFDKIVVPGEITNAQLETIKDMTIKVKAYAIQADGFETAEAAWKAYSEIK